jgi:hypothetical protein
MSTFWPNMLHRLLAALQHHFQYTQTIPTSSAGLSAVLSPWLARAAAQQRLVIVLDGLDQLYEGNQADLSWLPSDFPSNVRLLVSVGPGLVLHRLQERGWPILTVPPLQCTERKHLVVDYLAHFSKKLGTADLEAVVMAPATTHPLYLRTIVEELRLFGVYERFHEQMRAYLSASAIEPLFERVLARLEQDYQNERPHLVRDSLMLLAAARHGLSEAEVLDLLGASGSPLPAAYWSPFFLAVRELFVESSGLLTFFHSEFQKAVRQRYGGTETDLQRWHRVIAEYFYHRPWSPRKIEEFPWQLVRLSAWDALRDVLADLTFLEQAWPTHAVEVKAYWALLEANSSCRLAETYRYVVDSPITYGQGAWYVATLLGDTGHWPAVLQLSASLEAEARHQDDSTALRQLLALRGAALQATGHRDEAMRVLQDQAALCQAAGAQAELAANLSSQGVLRHALDDPEQALTLHQEAETLYRTLDDPIGLATALGNQAVIWMERGIRAKAWNLLRDQEQLCRTSGDLDGLQKALGNQAILHAEEGALHRALQLHQAVLRTTTQH